jgi:D-3-phosphoglycerate dehydrogenase / 2-oxoglutarate reductase
MKLLIVDKIHECLMTELQDTFDIDYKPGLSYEETFALISSFDALIVRTGISIDKALIEKGIKLKMIARAGAGMDNIDEVAAAARGIICLNAPEANRDAVAEQTAGMLLALLHNIVKADKEVRNALWQREENRGRELSYQTVGIIGYGNTGTEVAKRLKAFGCSILVYDKYKTGFGEPGIKECSMEMLFEQADVVSFHVPLTDLTYRMINSTFLSKFRKNIYLLNLSRGKIMETIDILKELNSGKIIGFASDVLENEQINHGLAGLSVDQQKNFIDLIERENVIITPHIGGWSVESYEKISKVLAYKLKEACLKLKENRNILVKH